MGFSKHPACFVHATNQDHGWFSLWCSLPGRWVLYGFLRNERRNHLPNWGTRRTLFVSELWISMGPQLYQKVYLQRKYGPGPFFGLLILSYLWDRQLGVAQASKLWNPEVWWVLLHRDPTHEPSSCVSSWVSWLLKKVCFLKVRFIPCLTRDVSKEQYRFLWSQNDGNLVVFFLSLVVSCSRIRFPSPATGVPG